MIESGGERGLGISALMARHDVIYIYMNIYRYYSVQLNQSWE